ncbi:MAG: response regulator [Croceibacterium sp.]
MTDVAPKTVLIVDDIEDNRVLLERALAANGLITISVEDGQSALAYLSSKVPDIILLDWMMPGLSGIETLRIIRQSYSASVLPVIMCTAVGEEEYVVDAISEGANDYVTKPFSLPILRARMKAHLSQSDTVAALVDEKAEAKRRLNAQTRELFSRLAAN